MKPKRRLIDRNAAIEAVMKDIANNTDTSCTIAYVSDKLADMLLKRAANRIRKLPTVDAVEVVRCRDCKFFVSDMEWCEADDEHPTRPDAFCSWAERRDDE